MTQDDVETLAELLSWTSGAFARYDPQNNVEHNKWSWRGGGHSETLKEEFRNQAKLLMLEGVVCGKPF